MELHRLDRIRLSDLLQNLFEFFNWVEMTNGVNEPIGIINIISICNFFIEIIINSNLFIFYVKYRTYIQLVT